MKSYTRSGLKMNFIVIPNEVSLPAGKAGNLDLINECENKISLRLHEVILRIGGSK